MDRPELKITDEDIRIIRRYLNSYRRGKLPKETTILLKEFILKIKATSPDLYLKLGKGMSIYMIECKESNMCYVGQSTDFEQRITQHQVSLRSNRHSNERLQEDYNKYGPEAFKYTVIKELGPECNYKDAMREEREHIIKFIKEDKELYNKLV